MEKKIFGKISNKFSLFFTILLITFLAGFFLGKNYPSYFSTLKETSKNDSQKLEENSPKNLEIKNKNPKEKSLDFSIFWEAWEVLEKNFYYKEKLNEQEMIYGAIKGMVKASGDPYTEFFKPDDAQKFLEDIQGEFGGIGAEIGKIKGTIKIIAPLKNSPAERAGLKPGDSILAVNGSSTTDLSLYEVVKKIRGKIGTKVILTILREGWEEPKDFEIVRELIKIPCLDLKIEKINHHKIAYLALYNFQQNLRNIFYKKAFEIIFENPEGIILDLRNNTGGYLNLAVEISSWFLKKGDLVVKEVFSDGEINSFKANRNGPFLNLPMVILINEGTASAAEIVAGALRDHRKIPLVGQKTFGKGSVQQVKYLSDGSFLKITIALWELPSGKRIEGEGLLPDYEIENDPNQSQKDLQLEKAKEILLQEIKTKTPFKFKNLFPSLKFDSLKIYYESHP